MNKEEKKRTREKIDKLEEGFVKSIAKTRLSMEEEWDKEKKYVALRIVNNSNEKTARIDEVVIFKQGLDREVCMRRIIRHIMRNMAEEGLDMPWDNKKDWEENLDELVEEEMKNRVFEGTFGDKQDSLEWHESKGVTYQIVGGGEEEIIFDTYCAIERNAKRR